MTATPVPEMDGPIDSSADSKPFLTAFVDGLPGSVVLEDHGYVEEEYFVSGGANKWRYDDEDTVEVDVADVPYTTRILVRRPKNAARLSGVAHLELLNPSSNFDLAPTWGEAHDYFLRSGDVYVAVTLKPVTAETMKRYFDPARYGRLDIRHNSQAWDIVGQVGALIKASDGPLGHLGIRRLFASGWSQTGGYLRTFLNDGFHARARMSDNRPVFDGFIVGVSGMGGYLPASLPDTPYTDTVDLNVLVASLQQDIHHVPPDDPRRRHIPQDVPVIDFMSEDEAVTHWAYSYPDSDEPGNRYRLYQVPGRGHAHGAGFESIALGIRMMQGTDFHPTFLQGAQLEEPNPLDIPSTALYHAVLDNLLLWVDHNVSPPHADPIFIKPPGHQAPVDARGRRLVLPEVDRFGNTRGGIRVPQLEVPLARYVRKTGTEGQILPGWHRLPFDEAEFKSEYRDPEDYLERFTGCVNRLVAGRWFLGPDASRIVLKVEADFAGHA